ncbi:MAG: uracil-DNA glycosylase [Phycisphaerales bacterium]
MDRAAKLVAQSAETSRLMGVDFVPVYRRPGSAPAARPDSAGAHAAMVEAKPSQPVAGAMWAAAAPSAVAGPSARDPAPVQARLDALRARYEREAPHRSFVTDHHSIVFGEGDPCARVMFVGEAPGAEEDRTGRPFVGPAGQLLNKMIAAMGLTREGVYIANVLKTRPPNNATPTSEEIALCAPYLFEQIGIVAPEAIVALGLPACRALLNTTEPMARLRHSWHAFVPPPPDAREIPVMPTYHPAFLLRAPTPENRGKVWADLKLVMARLGLSPPPRPNSDPA